MSSQFTAAIATEVIVVIAIFLIAALLTNSGAIHAAVERMGWM